MVEDGHSQEWMSWNYIQEWLCYWIAIYRSGAICGRSHYLDFFLRGYKIRGLLLFRDVLFRVSPASGST